MVPLTDDNVVELRYNEHKSATKSRHLWTSEISETSEVLWRTIMGSEVFLYIFLGFVQGTTEVLPISSSGHLVISGELLCTRLVSLDLALFLHLGTFFAILIYFAADIRDLLTTFLRSLSNILFPQPGWKRNPLRQRDTRVLWYLLASTLVTGGMGLLFQDAVNAIFLEQTGLVTVFLILNGLVVVAASQWTAGNKSMAQIGLRDYLLIGLAQGLAVFPGISRLGLTLCMGLARKMSWFESLKLSLLLSLPIVLGGAVMQAMRSWGITLPSPTFESGIGVLLGIVTATAGGLVAVRFLMNNVLERRSLVAFGVYCVLAGVFFTMLFLTFPQTSAQARALLIGLLGGV
jgi:undecaprenyl-diphosphatase